MALLLGLIVVLAGGCNSSSGSSAPASPTTGGLTVDYSPASSTGMSTFPAAVTNIQATATSSTAVVSQSQTVAVGAGSVPFTSLTTATDYSLDLKAVDSAGSTVWSGSASNVAVVANQTTTVSVSLACPTTQPAAFTTPLTITNIAPTSLTVNWTAQSQAGYTYRVYRSTSSSLCTVLANGTPLGSFQAGNSYNDSSLTANTAYNYAVVAKSSTGTETNYPPMAVTTLTSGQSITKMDTSNTLPAQNISSVTVDPNDYKTVYVTISNFGVTHHLYKSTDEGATWTSLDGTAPNNIPDIPVQCLFIDPLNTQHMFLGTDLGVMFSSDGGATWVTINTGGMATVDVERFAYQASTRKLVAFTHGRGAYALTLP